MTLLHWLQSGFDEPRKLIAQILGFIPLSLSFFVFTQKEQKKTLFFKACSDCLKAIHFFLLAEFSGGAINTVNTFRDIVFSQKEKQGLKSPIIPAVFILFTIVCAIPDFQGIKSLLPTVGSCLAIIGFWQTNLTALRLFNLSGILLWLVYGIWTVSVSTILYNVFSIVSISMGLYKTFKK